MKVLALTGATGKKSGGVLATNIINNIDVVSSIFPDGIRMIARKTSNTSFLESSLSNLDVKRGELTDIDFLKHALKDVDTCIHLSGIHWSREIVEAAAFCGVRRLILIHTTGVYSKYKEAGEEYRKIDEFVYKTCKEHGIFLTICRPTMIYGNVYDNNVVKFIRMVDKFPIMPVVNGANYELQPVHYEDLGNAYYQILINEKETAGKDYILSGAKPILLKEMFNLIGKNLGKKVHYVSCPFWLAYSGAWIIYCLTIKKIDYRERVQRLCEPRIFDHKEATADFGYSPRDFSEGIVKEVAEYKETSK